MAIQMDYFPVGQEGTISSRHFKEQFRNNLYTWIYSFLAGIWLPMTIMYAWSLTITRGPLVSLVPASPARAVVILQILSGGAAFLLAQLIGLTLEVVVWAIACSDNGITMASFLGT